MRFLLIEDEADILSLVERVVKARGHECRCAHSAKEALKALDANRFDRIVSDLKMPEMTGDELYDLLVARAHPLAARMAFMTGNRLESRNREFLERSGALVLEKPFSIAKLKEFLRKVEDMGERKMPANPGSTRLVTKSSHV